MNKPAELRKLDSCGVDEASRFEHAESGRHLRPLDGDWTDLRLRVCMPKFCRDSLGTQARQKDLCGQNKIETAILLRIGGFYVTEKYAAIWIGVLMSPYNRHGILKEKSADHGTDSLSKQFAEMAETSPQHAISINYSWN